MSSGRIVACDPLIVDAEPFTVAFPKGEFPVELAIARIKTDERVAFARVVSRTGPSSGGRRRSWPVRTRRRWRRTSSSATAWTRGAALFSSVWGDGMYPSYVGYDASGKVVRLLTDFQVADTMP